ncbi:MAG: hypothetical protein B7Y86_12890 [Brevundimonas subvibrioides]|uniref:EF-hand domain-containing protein n=1 Tax=Brevundimonas subvibrioides TaxID=74313 RepID=A0A258HEY1_9CAUL|nr:hypothetical protein [Brevundimonas subvibrioides]OYX55550.1 MAG: hypothetical protein B7Y86_12890 [Brevundimonas subvibrioides]
MTKTPKSKERALAPVVVETEALASPSLMERAGRLGDSARTSFQSGMEATRVAAGRAGAGLAKAGGDIGRSAGVTAKAAGRAGNAAMHAVGDLNGDGKIDEADFRIARDAAGRAAAVVSREAGELGKSVARSEITKDAAAGAVVGALIAVPIPIVGPVAGAAFGAAIGMARGVLGSNALGDIAGQVVAGARKPARRKAAPRKKPAT